MSAEILAFLAAQLDPVLARTKPARAIEVARNLLLAADPGLTESFDDDHDQALFEANLAVRNFAEGRFPVAERIDASEAFKIFDALAHNKDKYKSPDRFWAAMQKGGLTIKSRRSARTNQWFSILTVAPKGHPMITEEATTREAVGQLVKIKAENRRRIDRIRKAGMNRAKGVKGKKTKNISGSKQSKIGVPIGKAGTSGTKNRNRAGQKRKIKIKR